MPRILLPPVLIVVVVSLSLLTSRNQRACALSGRGRQGILPLMQATAPRTACFATRLPSARLLASATTSKRRTAATAKPRTVAMMGRGGRWIWCHGRATARGFSPKIAIVPPLAAPHPLRREALVVRPLATTSSDHGVHEGEDNMSSRTLKPGDKIQVEVTSFGPLGASVEIVALGHDPDDVPPSESSGSDPAAGAIGRGLVLQREIAYFRQARSNVDVVRGEILPAYVERVRDNGSVDVSLRSYGGKAKSEDVAAKILERLGLTYGGELPIGDKSAPEEIQKEFPGVSKANFKKAVSSLYKQGIVKPGPFSIELMKHKDNKY